MVDWQFIKSLISFSLSKSSPLNVLNANLWTFSSLFYWKFVRLFTIIRYGWYFRFQIYIEIILYIQIFNSHIWYIFLDYTITNCEFFICTNKFEWLFCTEKQVLNAVLHICIKFISVLLPIYIVIAFRLEKIPILLILYGKNNNLIDRAERLVFWPRLWLFII